MQAKFIELGIEDLEERIAPGIATLTIIAAGIDVVGPAQATGGAVTAFTNVSADLQLSNNAVTLSHFDASVGLFAGELAEVEFEPVILEPRDRRTVLVELRLAQNGIVAAAVEVHHDSAAGFDLHGARGLDKLAVQRFRLALVEAVKLARKPTVTAVG